MHRHFLCLHIHSCGLDNIDRCSSPYLSVFPTIPHHSWDLQCGIVLVHLAIHSRLCKLGPIIHKVSISPVKRGSFTCEICARAWLCRHHSQDTFSHSHRSRRHAQALIVIGRQHHSHRHTIIPSAIIDLIVEAVDGFILLSTISRHQVSDFCLAPLVGTKSPSLLSTICRHQVFNFSSTPNYPAELCSCDEL